METANQTAMFCGSRKKICWLVLSVCFLQGRSLESSYSLEYGDLNVSFKYKEDWENWKQTHSKKYTDVVDELLRHLTWLSNLKFIEMHNANAHIFGFELAMNHLGDMVSP